MFDFSLDLNLNLNPGVEKKFCENDISESECVPESVCVPVVCYRHWISAIQSITPSVSTQDMQAYESWSIETHSTHS